MKNTNTIAPTLRWQGSAPTVAYWNCLLQQLDRPGGFHKNHRVAKAIGIGVPMNRRTNRHRCGFFFVRRHGTSLYGRAMRGSASCAGSCSRYANPHGSAHPDWCRGKRTLSTAVQEAFMPIITCFALRPAFPLHAAFPILRKVSAGIPGAKSVCAPEHPIRLPDHGDLAAAEVVL